eukprot:gene10161-1835_t
MARNSLSSRGARVRHPATPEQRSPNATPSRKPSSQVRYNSGIIYETPCTPVNPSLSPSGSARSPWRGSRATSKATHSPSATITAAQRGLAARLTPGPGDYEVAPRRSKSSGHGIIGGTSRFRRSEVTPGPGDYETSHAKSRNSPHASMGGTPRRHTQRTTPGPGSYNGKKSQFGTRGMTIPQSPRAVQARPTPGPGDYTPLRPRSHSAGPGTISRARRMELLDSQPGPGDYDLDYSSLTHKGAHITSAQRVLTSPMSPGPGVQVTPGPGDYSGERKVKPGPRATIGNDGIDDYYRDMYEEQ